jgi:ABC-type multidrug transport system ATPase subunit
MAIRFAIETAGLTNWGDGRGAFDVSLRVKAACLARRAQREIDPAALVGLTPPDRTISMLGLSMPADRVAVLSRIGFVDEERALYDDMAVGEILAFAASFQPSWDAGYASGMIRDFGLREGDRVGKLSRGGRAELALAIALGGRPELLVLDEPTGGLDILVRHEFLEKFIHLVCDTRATVLFSSHLLEDVERVADEVGFMEAGRLLFQSEVEPLRAAYADYRAKRGDAPAAPLLMDIFISVVRVGFRPPMALPGPAADPVPANPPASPAGPAGGEVAS